MEWTKEEILDYININGFFASFKLNRISSFIVNPFNQIYFIDQSSFKINFIGQSTPNP